MRALADCYLYGIVDLGYVPPERVREVTEKLVEGRIDLLQLRAKDLPIDQVENLGQTMLEVTAPAGVPLILNDYPDLLRTVAAQGCHVGQEDYPIADARALAGRPCVVGKSTHSFEQALAAEAEGADYLGFGPIFATPTKPAAVPLGPEQIRAVTSTVDLPVFCIGGINAANLDRIKTAGASRICVVSALLLVDDIAKQTTVLRCRLGEDIQAHEH